VGEQHEWAEDEQTRYGVYRLVPGVVGPNQVAVCELDNIGYALKTLRAEGEFDADGCRVGILDGIEGKWVVDPYKGIDIPGNAY
jgi:hypothetical protein